MVNRPLAPKTTPSKNIPYHQNPPKIDARRAADLMKALSNESRVQILCELLEGERCVHELESVVGLSQSALSQHLAKLRHDGVVKTRRDGKTICYSLNGNEPAIVLEVLYRLFSDDDDDDAPTAGTSTTADKDESKLSPSPR